VRSIFHFVRSSKTNLYMVQYNVKRDYELSEEISRDEHLQQHPGPDFKEVFF
jgi:hypothetical protein